MRLDGDSGEFTMGQDCPQEGEPAPFRVTHHCSAQGLSAQSSWFFLLPGLLHPSHSDGPHTVPTVLSSAWPYAVPPDSLAATSVESYIESHAYRSCSRCILC